MPGWGRAVDLLLSANHLVCAPCSQSLTCKSSQSCGWRASHTYTAPYIHNQFCFYTVRRGRSPTIAQHLGLLKARCARGWSTQQPPGAGARTRGGHLSHAGGLELSLSPGQPPGAAAQSADMPPAPRVSSDTTAAVAELLRDRGAAVARRDQISVQGWQHHPCGCWSGATLRHSQLVAS